MHVISTNVQPGPRDDFMIETGIEEIMTRDAVVLPVVAM
jgi:hypothetical protein